MNKAELCDKISERLSLNKRQVENVINAFTDITATTLKDGNEVTLTGFGTFMAKFRSARLGVNPRQPNEKIQIPAVTVPKFKAGKALKDALKAKE